MTEHAVFFDPSRRRWWWIKRIGTLFGLLSVIAVSLFLISLFSTPFLPGMPGITTAIQRSLRRSVHLPRHQTRLQQYLLARDRKKLLTQVAEDRKVLRAKAAQPAMQRNGIVAAFYAPWQETGLESLRVNAGSMTHLLPAWVHLQPNGKGLDFRDWDEALTPHNRDVIEIARANNLNIIPVLSNAQQSNFDPDRAHLFLTNPIAQSQIISQLRNWCLTYRYQGINIDFENLHDEDYPLLLPFYERVRNVFAPDHLIVTADLSVNLESSKPTDWTATAALCEFVVVMAYDEHGTGSKPGAIASIDWYRKVLQRALREIPRDKLVIGLANYGYDWMEGQGPAEPLTYERAVYLAKKHRAGESAEKVVDFDPEALNPTFWYDDDDGTPHEVWFLDAVTFANQWMIAQNYGLRGVGIWVLGSTDPSIWTFIHRDGLASSPDPVKLRKVSFPYAVDFIGEGEILHVETQPADGARDLEVDSQSGLFVDESYHSFATSALIGRTGYKPMTVALTIDDGPADPYTGQMLDAMKEANVKATFFLIGQNAERYPGLVKRIWREGHEIGNHSYTHPNIGAVNRRRAEFELTATQRVFQSLLHRSTLLFRPPYNADASPSAEEEVKPIELASSWNYVTVGEFIDPQDWNITERHSDGTVTRRDAKQMLDSVIEQLQTEHGSCILIHDGGGDREETVKLIPMLITELRKRGYRFVTVSELINATRDQVNPPVKDADTFMLANDRAVFELIYLLELFLTVAFISAIILGTLRVAFVTFLAVVGHFRNRRRSFDDAYRPTVSVIIAAFNEEKVIARTLEAVLASGYESLDVIVVDDGSKDDTAGLVERQFENVLVLRQENAGKAAALNRGIAHASGEIIIALDADTLFTRDTIAHLVRRFADPLVGAVAGNVKVGNRINPLTYWQAIEYVTSQNLDRRAYSLLNAVAVVPGAVGAWRREAILQAGGYTTDTMAEDMDLTWRIRRIGWTIDTDSTAIGYTEAPDSFAALFQQRFRWAFGTLQCLWKHRRALGRYGCFGRVMLPSLWLFQVVYQALSPLVDLQLLWAAGLVMQALIHAKFNNADWQPLPQAMTSLWVIGFMYAFFFVVELIGAAVAFKLDKEDGKMLVWLFWQRFLYRQLMYAVLIKSLKTAVTGIRTGWGKLERKGTVELATADVPTVAAGFSPPGTDEASAG